jgi:hypothetical protein
MNQIFDLTDHATRNVQINGKETSCKKKNKNKNKNKKKK